MQIVDFYPLKGFFLPGEKLTFRLVLKASHSGSSYVHLRLFSLQDCQHEVEMQVTYQSGSNRLKLEVPFDSKLSVGGYALSLQTEEQQCWTSFDLQHSWLDFPRYGFLSDFSTELQTVPEVIEKRIEDLAKYHLTGLQFYDWQYRHDQLVAPEEEYLDPLHRHLSLNTIRSLISAAHQSNLASMPYLAVYGASIEFWHQHPDWGMYTEEGQPLLFEDFLGLMDPSPDSPWFKHLSNQCRQTLAALPFDGLHVDQYGDPKQAFTHEGLEIDIPGAFVNFIDTQKETLRVPVIFNAVGNWPIEALAGSQADLMYIEVWPPTPRFLDLQQIVENARNLSGEKPVIIPLYIQAANKTNVLLADAVIAASGGTHLELGDNLKLLSDPYFPKSESLPQDYLQDLRHYWDFIVAYQGLLGPRAENIKLPVNTPRGIHCISRRQDAMLAIHLIQLFPKDCWTEPQAPRQCLSDIPLQVTLPGEVVALYWSSPDSGDLQLHTLDFDQQGKELTCHIPTLTHWSMLLINLAD